MPTPPIARPFLDAECEWFDDPCFDDMVESVGGVLVRGDAWRHAMQQREQQHTWAHTPHAAQLAAGSPARAARCAARPRCPRLQLTWMPKGAEPAIVKPGAATVCEARALHSIALRHGKARKEIQELKRALQVAENAKKAAEAKATDALRAAAKAAKAKAKAEARAQAAEKMAAPAGHGAHEKREDVQRAARRFGSEIAIDHGCNRDIRSSGWIFPSDGSSPYRGRSR